MIGRKGKSKTMNEGEFVNLSYDGWPFRWAIILGTCLPLLVYVRRTGIETCAGEWCCLLCWMPYILYSEMTGLSDGHRIDLVPPHSNLSSPHTVNHPHGRCCYFTTYWLAAPHLHHSLPLDEIELNLGEKNTNSGFVQQSEMYDGWCGGLEGGKYELMMAMGSVL